MHSLSKITLQAIFYFEDIREEFMKSSLLDAPHEMPSSDNWQEVESHVNKEAFWLRTQTY